MDLEPRSLSDKLTASHAAHWHRLLPEGSQRIREDFVEWLLDSRRNVRNYLLLTAYERELIGNIDPDRKHDVDTLLADGSDNVLSLNTTRGDSGAELTSVDAGNVSATSSDASASPDSQLTVSADEAEVTAQLSNSVSSNRKLPRWTKLAAAAALTGIAALAGISRLTGVGPDVITGWHTYATIIGEQRAVELEDGSIVHLNTRSRVQVRMADHTRDIRLLEGEAVFKVHHDASRPFRVYTDDAVVQAIGTQFNVYRRPEGTRVAVLEGRVRVTDRTPRRILPQIAPTGEGATTPETSVTQQPTAITGSANPQRGKPANAITLQSTAGITEVGAGEEAVVLPAGQIEKKLEADVQRTVAWRQRRLEFREDTLSDIITEFNRYNRSPQFRLEGTTVATRRYTGVFDADDPESLALLLSRERDLMLERASNEIVIRSRFNPTMFARDPRS